MRSLPLADYLDKLASSDAAPGGGAAAAVTAAQGAALLAMALRLTGGDAAAAQLGALDDARARLLQLAVDDGIAFERVLAAYKLRNVTPGEKAERTAAVQDALKGAAAVPLEVMTVAAELLETAEAVVATAKRTVVSDAGIAVQLLSAAMRASRFNVEVNLAYLKDAAFVEKVGAEVGQLLAGERRRRKALVKAARKMILAPS